jgi:hypothetical protein
MLDQTTKKKVVMNMARRFLGVLWCMQKAGA